MQYTFLYSVPRQVEIKIFPFLFLTSCHSYQNHCYLFSALPCTLLHSFSLPSLSLSFSLFLSLSFSLSPSLSLSSSLSIYLYVSLSIFLCYCLCTLSSPMPYVGLGRVRCRFPIAPVHSEGSTVGKEVSALRDMLTGYLRAPPDMVTFEVGAWSNIAAWNS